MESLFWEKKIYSFCRFTRLFALAVLSCKNLFRSFYLSIIAFLMFSGTKFELLDIINFRFLESRLSSTDEKIVVNSNKSTLFKSIFNNSLFSSV